MVFFNKRKRENKKRLQAEAKQHLNDAKDLTGQIDEEHKKLAEKEPLLKKDLRIAVTQEKGFAAGLKKGLSKTKRFFTGNIFELASEEKADEDFLEELEERLYTADMGGATTLRIMELIREQIKKGSLVTQSQVIESIKGIITEILTHADHSLPVAAEGPSVYFFVGVNGVGKTTSIGKLAAKFQAEGKRVIAAAGDTFRAAAIEQLESWCDRNQIPLVKKPLNSDPSAVLYEACERAKNENYDVLLCDTSGRLHTKGHLMEELRKMKRSIQKVIPDAPHASILVLDANTGQNAIMQTKEFSAVVDLDGLVITKLDGTAKGGVVIGIVNEFELPIYFVGVGEQVEDLKAFSATEFAEGLMG